jgi:hypothetical protein
MPVEQNVGTVLFMKPTKALCHRIDHFAAGRFCCQTDRLHYLPLDSAVTRGHALISPGARILL